MHRLLYLQYTNPAGYPPLEHSSRILAKAGWRILFLGAGSRGTHALAFPPCRSIEVRMLGPRPGGWRQKVHYLVFCLWAWCWLLRWRPRWVYASDPLSCLPALAMSLVPGFRVVYHEHDSPAAGDGVFMKACLWARARLAKRAAACVLPHPVRAQRFSQATGAQARTLCVYNCPRVEETLAQPRGPWTGPKLVAYYHGNVGPELVPMTLITALSQLRGRVELWIVGYEAGDRGGYIRELLGAAAAQGLADALHVAPPVSRHGLWPLLRRCDVGLALMPTTSENPNFGNMAGASNKAFDYLAGGLALLVSDLPEWKRMYVEPGYGLVCDPADPQSIAQTLQRFMDNPQAMRAMGERGRRRVLDEWNYQSQFDPVRALLDGRCPVESVGAAPC